MPTLYLPLFMCGIFLSSLIIEVIWQIVDKFFTLRAFAGLSIIGGILALFLHGTLSVTYLIPPNTPEPVKIWPIFLSQLQASSAVIGVFCSLRAVKDRASAVLGLILSLIALFLIGLRGTTTYPGKSSALTTVLVAAVLLIFGGIVSIVEYYRGHRK